MKKSSMKFLGLLFLLCFVFTQSAFAQTFKSDADSRAAVQAEVDVIQSSQSVLSLADAQALSTKALSLRYFDGFIAQLDASATVETAFNQNHAIFEQHSNPVPNYDQVLVDVRDRLLTLITVE